MKKLTSNLINIPGFEKLQPSNATSDDTNWESSAKTYHKFSS